MAQNSLDRRRIADAEFARRRAMIQEITNVPDSVKMELLFQDYLELYGLCHEHRGGYYCWYSERAKNDSVFADKVRRLK